MEPIKLVTAPIGNTTGDKILRLIRSATSINIARAK